MQEGRLPEVDAVAKRLSTEIHCSLRLPERGMYVLVCKHNVVFSVSRLIGSDDWSWVVEKHNKEQG